MRKYPAENWRALGQWIHDARNQAGYSDSKRWAGQVGRSTRQLLGLERGEPVGAKTLEAVAEALGVAPWSLFAQLVAGRNVDFMGADPADIARYKAEFTAETGIAVEEWAPTWLEVESIPDDVLIAELTRRLRSARSQGDEDEGDEDGTPATPTGPGDSPSPGSVVANLSTLGDKQRAKRTYPKPETEAARDEDQE